MVEVETCSGQPNSSVQMFASGTVEPSDEVLERVNELKRLQIDYFHIQAEFHKEVADLEHKYYGKYESLLKKRKDVINGDVKAENTDELTGENEVKSADSVDRAKVKGIPNFWLTCLKNVGDDIPEVVTLEDEPILQHLKDIEIEDNVDSFKVHFYFGPNDYFTNEVLTKEFKLSLGPSDENPLEFDGPEIIAMKGTQIEWKSDDKNVTQRIVATKLRNKVTGELRTCVKTLPTDSFFNFFSNPKWVETTDDMSHSAAASFQADITLGSFLRERLLPRAVLYFTGEASGDYDDFDGDQEDLDESEEDFDFDGVQKSGDEKEETSDCKQN